MRRQEAALTPVLSPAKRERGEPQARGEGRTGRLPKPSRVIREAARELRSSSTASEVLLWGALRNRGLAGCKFRRQHPVGRFVLDFYCHEERLAVEVDGPVHKMRRGADRERQRMLESMGIRLLRLPTALVEGDLAVALSMIEDALSPVASPARRERREPQARGEG